MFSRAAGWLRRERERSGVRRLCQEVEALGRDLTKELELFLQDTRRESPAGIDLSGKYLSPDLELNLRAIREGLGSPADLVVRTFAIGSRHPVRAGIAYFDGMADTMIINQNLLRPLMLEARSTEPREGFDRQTAYAVVREYTLHASEVAETANLQELLNRLSAGRAALLLDGFPWALLVTARGFKERAVEEPDTESVVRGPREGFTENIRTNTALLRRKISNHRLRLEPLSVGRLTRTQVIIAYVEGIAREEMVREVRLRLSRIRIDGVLDGAYLEELIQDQPFSPFPQVQNTERPDRVAAEILEGRVAILVDGTPFALLVPAVLAHFMNSPDDYYDRSLGANLIRVVRYLSGLVALTLPSFYVAIVSFHQEMIPSTLALSIAAGREAVPFPAFVEALLMEFTFEVLREAGIRLPRVAGQAVTIVGALVVGEAAVRAGVVSPIMVIVVATTAIASFVMPAFNAALAIRVLRFPLIFLAGALGFFGIIWGLLALLLHLASLRSFGVPYLAPLAPLVPSDLKDVPLRAPRWAMRRRPEMIAEELGREPAGLRPGAREGRTGRPS